MKLNPTPLEIIVLLQLCATIYAWTTHHKRWKRWWREWRQQRRGRRHLRPRDPSACPRCVHSLGWLERHPYPDVVPWHEVKRQAGRPKRIDTHGYACLNVQCEYYGITDGNVHALVSDGKRNGVQYWRCQACGGRKTSRLATPMYQLKTPSARVAMVMTALSEGVDIAAATRIFGHHPTTIQRWVERSGGHSQRLHTRVLFRALDVGHVQLDELVTRVKRERERLWVWTAVAASSKLIMAVHVGGRTTVDACRLIHQVWERLKPACWPVYTSGGLNQYFYALTAHFGEWGKPPRARKYHWVVDARLKYAQLRKRRQGRTVTFLYSIICLGVRETIRAALQSLGFTGRIQTAYVERANLTLHIYWELAYYHFIRPHQSLEQRVRSPGQPRYRTPAMAAGLTRRRRTVAELLMTPVPETGELAPFPVI